jgi:hypothetical protein
MNRCTINNKQLTSLERAKQTMTNKFKDGKELEYIIEYNNGILNTLKDKNNKESIKFMNGEFLELPYFSKERLELIKYYEIRNEEACKNK